MKKISLTYEGGLRCKGMGDAGAILTDAPKGYGGRGEALSPTEILVFSLGSCMITLMAIAAQKNGLDIKGATAEGYEEMAHLPARRIGKVALSFSLPAGIPVDKRGIIETAAKTCPVHQSLHPDIQIRIDFKYPD